MKKLILPALFALFGLGFFAKPVAVFAEENTEPTISENVEQENEQEVSGLIAQLKEYGVDVEQIVNFAKGLGIVSVGTIVSALTALLGVVAKYSKYKHTTIETLMNTVKEKSNDYLKENFEKLSGAEITKIVDKIGDLEKATETIMKVLVLMQDSTTKGKVALLDYLGSKTTSAEVKASAETLNEKLAEKEEIESVVKDQVKEDYENIF